MSGNFEFYDLPRLESYCVLDETLNVSGLFFVVCVYVCLNAAAEVRWGNTATFSLKSVGFPCKKLRAATGGWRRVSVSARYDSRGDREDASTLSEMATLVDDLAKLNAMVNEANKGIGADVRNRVDVLFNRATLLKYSADRMVDRGGRVPVQLTATLKVLTD